MNLASVVQRIEKQMRCSDDEVNLNGLTVSQQHESLPPVPLRNEQTITSSSLCDSSSFRTGTTLC